MAKRMIEVDSRVHLHIHCGSTCSLNMHESEVPVSSVIKILEQMTNLYVPSGKHILRQAYFASQTVLALN
jgi:hypothetical protein